MPKRTACDEPHGARGAKRGRRLAQEPVDAELRLEMCADKRLWCMVVTNGAPCKLVLAVLTTPQLADLPEEPTTGEAGRALWSTVLRVGPEARTVAVAIPRTVIESRGSGPSLHFALWPKASADVWTTNLTAYAVHKCRPEWGTVPDTKRAEEVAELLVQTHGPVELLAAISAYIQGVDYPTDAGADLACAAQGWPRVASIVWMVTSLLPKTAQLDLIRHLAAPLGAREGPFVGEPVRRVSDTGTDAASLSSSVIAEAFLRLPVVRGDMHRTELTLVLRRDPKTGLPLSGDLKLAERQLSSLMWRRLCEPLWDEDSPPAPPSPHEAVQLMVEYHREPGHGPAVTDEALRALAASLMAGRQLRAVLLDPDCQKTPSAELQDALACVGYLAARFFLSNLPCEALAEVPVGVWAAALACPYPCNQEDKAAHERNDGTAYMQRTRTAGRVPNRLAQRALRVGVRWAFGQAAKWAAHVVTAEDVHEALRGQEELTLTGLLEWTANAESLEGQIFTLALTWVLDKQEQKCSTDTEKHEARQRVLKALFAMWTGSDKGIVPKGGLASVRPRGKIGVGPSFVAHQCAHQIDIPSRWIDRELAPDQTGPLLELALFDSPRGYGFA